MRLNKFLAQSGVASRRKCDELILEGKVKINGKVVKELGVDVNTQNDSVYFDGRRVKPVATNVYFKLHKPKGYVTTASDDKDRKTVLSLMRNVQYRIFPIGRLDYDTEGLLLLTNDGELTNILTHPKNSVAKTYVANIEGVVTDEEIKQLSSGVDIGGYVTKPCSVILLDRDDKSTKLEISITEGKNRQVKKMIEAVGKNVAFLKRVSIGEIRLGGLARGEYKELNKKEMQYINKLKNSKLN